MQVKIGDYIFDGENTPILVVLSDKDKQNIASMPPGNRLYCVHNDSIPDADVYAWMEKKGVDATHVVLVGRGDLRDALSRATKLLSKMKRKPLKGDLLADMKDLEAVVQTLEAVTA